MPLTKTLSKLNICREINPQTPDIPEKQLLAAILGRALFDLAPEAKKEDRRGAIQWFKGDYDLESKEDELTCFERVRDELELGGYMVELVMGAVKKAEEFEEYRLRCLRDKIPVSVEAWKIPCTRGNHCRRVESR